MTDGETFFEKLFREYYDAVAAYCSAMLAGDSAEGELCAHEVFDQALSDVERLMRHPNPVGWLKKTASHRVSRYLREKAKRARHEVHITEISEKYLEAEKVIDDYDTAFMTDKTIEQMKDEVLSKLTDEEKKLYEYRFVQGLTYKDIAPLIELSESATRIRTVRIEQKLRRLIDELFGG